MEYQYLRELNEQQKIAATTIDGPLLIIAGAGAGKTKTLTHRIVHLIKNGVSPERILAVTFTNKAAKEMREKINILISANSDKECPPEKKPFVSTFHALGVHILRQNHERASLSKYFSILDKQESLSVIKKATKECGFDPKIFNPQKTQAIISKNKNGLISKDKYADLNDTGPSFFKNAVSQIWSKYEQELNENKSLDFDDLIMKTVILLRENQDILSFYQDLWEYIHIDEYQDTNTSQYEISKMLAGANQNICAVGDNDQAIYGWRNADFRNILNFEKNFRDTKIITLEQNYRSTQNILSAANDIIKKNRLRKEKNLYTKNEEGEKITVYEAYDGQDEAAFVINEAKKLSRQNLAWNKIAILYRANFQSRLFEEECLKRDVPYQLIGTKFYERKEIKDAIAFLRASLNQTDKGAILRIINVPARGIGKTTTEKMFSEKTADIQPKTEVKIKEFYNILDKIKRYAEKNKVSQTIKFIIKESGMEEMHKQDKETGEDRLQNLRELVTLASKYDELPPNDALDKFLTETALLIDEESSQSDQGGIKLMTIHAAKGLEFNSVFVVGLENGLFPYDRFDDSEAEKEEERRLFYVAITRAQKKLFLSFAETRLIYGSKRYNSPSEFLKDLEKSPLIEMEKSQLTESLNFSASGDYRHHKEKIISDEKDDIVWECLS